METTTNFTKSVEYTYIVNGEREVKTVDVPMTDQEIIEAKKNSLKLKVAKGEATADEKADLALLQ